MLRTLGSASCVVTFETGAISYGHWGVHLVISHTTQGVRFVTGIGFMRLTISYTRQRVGLVTEIGFCIL